MQTQRYDVKIFADPGQTADPDLLIPVLQRWIRDKALPGLLIDVADYSHVPEGPGVALVGHEAHYYLDSTKGRLGLLYSRRRAGAADPERGIAEALVAALHACKLLQEDTELAGKLSFSGKHVFVRVNDRLAAPNTPESFEALRPSLDAVFARAYDDYTLSARAPSPEALTVDVESADDTSVEALLSRLG